MFSVPGSFRSEWSSSCIKSRHATVSDPTRGGGGFARVSLLGYTALSSPAQAASSKGCEGGGFTALGHGPGFDGTTPAPGGRFRVQGKYTQFDVDPTDFAVYDQAFTGAPNELDQTGGRFTPIYASKVPDHRGLSLTSAISSSLARNGAAF